MCRYIPVDLKATNATVEMDYTHGGHVTRNNKYINHSNRNTVALYSSSIALYSIAYVVIIQYSTWYENENIIKIPSWTKHYYYYCPQCPMTWMSVYSRWFSSCSGPLKKHGANRYPVKDESATKRIFLNSLHRKSHAHTHIYIYIYIYICVCVCVCVCVYVCVCVCVYQPIRHWMQIYRVSQKCIPIYFKKFFNVFTFWGTPCIYIYIYI